MSTELADARAPKLRRALTITAIGAVLAATAVVISAPAQAIGPTTIRVDTGGINAPTCGGATQQCLTIQYAIDKANSGDTVQVAAGTYNEIVTIAKGINLQGAGAADTFIDGTGTTSGPDGLVNIGTTDGDVTIAGFTIQNPVAGTVFGPHSISMIDPTASDRITITHNTILGWADSPTQASDAQIGIDSANTFAKTTITHNDISGVWQGVLLEGNRGALDVSDNHIHHLTPYVDGDAMYPAEGVYILSDKESSASAQDVTHNLFDHFNGIGIAVSAGYNLAGCDPGPCNGSVTGSISDNTFALLANAPGFLTASAIRLRATNANDALILTMGGNTGTVLAPTKTFEESPGNGTITITPSSPPNTIVTVPAPTLAVNTPASITTAEQPVAFSLASHNGSGENFSHARFQVTLTGDPGLSADQVHLQSKVGSSVFQNVALSGTTSDGGIVGFIEPAAGFDYLDGADAPNDFRLSFALGAPGGSLTSTVRLVEVSQGTGHPELNTLATDADTITVVANHAPTAADQTLSVKHDHDLAIVLASTEADGDTPLVFTHGSPDVGTLTDTDSQHLTYTPPALYVGPDSFSYTVTDSVGAETTGTVHITVTNAAPSAPNKSVTTTAGHPVAVTLNGTDADGDSLTYDNSNPSRGTLSGTAPNLTYTPNGFYVGADTFTYTTNDGIDSSTVGTVSIRVNKVVSTTTMVVTQNVPGAAPRLRIKATVTAPGAHIDTALVTIKDGTTTIGSARLVNGQINVLFTNIKKGVHTLYVYFPGSLSATASSASYHLRVFG